MSQDPHRTEELLIEEEMKDAYLTFAMSVIISRALPDVRDGLKPVQRRILMAMHELDLGPRSKTRKCGKIVGDVHGNYHPHGEQAIYDTLVRMAQPFTLRYPLVDSQGNFGSLDGDPPAAQRYTEARLSALGAEMLLDLDLDTIDFTDNYDNTRREPTVLPGRFPCLLANGAQGIAVGMATSIPPHNIRELCDAIALVMERPDASVRELMEVIPGPDLPTGGIICGQQGIYEGYATGRGGVVLRAKTHLEDSKRGRRAIVVTEPPYKMDRDTIVARIAEAVQAGRVQDVSDVRNESDKQGTRLVIELKREADDQVVLNQLYRHTPLQTGLGINLIAVVNGRPETLDLRALIQHYVDHRRDAIRRRTQHLLDEAEARAHILEGLKIAIINIDEVIRIIRTSREVAEARSRLMDAFGLTEPQVDAIVAMRLRSLVGLEQIKVEQEHAERLAQIAHYRAILADPQRVDDLIRADLADLKAKYGDARRTAIAGEAEILEVEDLVPEQDTVVTVTYRGYVKRTLPDTFRAQGRGGKGVIGADLQEDDFVTDVFVSSTHDYMMLFTNLGLAYWLKVFLVPEMDRTGRGRALVNLLELREGEKVAGIVPVKEFEEGGYLLMATAQGTVKKTALGEFGKRGSGGIIAVSLAEGDQLIGVRRTRGDDDVILCTRGGKAIRFSEQDVRPMGRTAAGVRGIALAEDDSVVGMALAREETDLLTVCERGYGKRTAFDEYPRQKRGGQGVRDIRATDRNGSVVAAREAAEDDELLFVSEKGMTVRIPVSSISRIGRNTQGVTIMAIAEGDRVSGLAAVHVEAEEAPAPAPAVDSEEENEYEEPSPPAAAEGEEEDWQ